MTFRKLAAAGATLALVTGASDYLLHDGIGHATTPSVAIEEGVGPIFNGYTWSNGIQGTGASVDVVPTAVEYAFGAGRVANGHMWDDGIQGTGAGEDGHTWGGFRSTGAAADGYTWSNGLRPDATAIEYGLVADWGGEVL